LNTLADDKGKAAVLYSGIKNGIQLSVEMIQKIIERQEKENYGAVADYYNDNTFRFQSVKGK